MLFCHITTMVPGEKYGDLLQEKGGIGFPYLVFMDAEGNVIQVHSEDMTPAEFAKTGEKAKSYVVAKLKADKGDPSAKIDFVIFQLNLGKIKVEEAQKRLKETGTPTKEQQAKLDAELLNASVLEMAKGEDEDALKNVRKKFYDLHKAGKPAPTSSEAIQAYYILIIGAADEMKDVEVFAAALKVLRDKFGSVEGARLFFEAKELRLEELKAETGDPAAKIDVVILQLAFGKIKAEEALKTLKEAGPLTKEQQAKLDAELLNASVLEMARGAEGEDALKAVGKRFYDLHKAGKPAPTNPEALRIYYMLTLGAADGLKDVEIFAAALKILKDKFGALEGVQNFFQTKEKRLEELRAEKK